MTSTGPLEFKPGRARRVLQRTRELVAFARQQGYSTQELINMIVAAS